MMRKIVLFCMLAACDGEATVDQEQTPIWDQGPDQCKADTCDPNCNNSPIIIDVAGNGFNLTDAAHGVNFDIAATGHTWSIAWTTALSDDSFLAFDQNGDGLINDGTELFGSNTPQHATANPNGFIALDTYDSNADGYITSADWIWPYLVLWNDKNHNGVTDTGELKTLGFYGITSISANGSNVGAYNDLKGNYFGYKGAVAHSGSTYNVGPLAWDVFFQPGIIPIGDQGAIPNICLGGGGGGGPVCHSGVQLTKVPDADTAECWDYQGHDLHYTAQCASCYDNVYDGALCFRNCFSTYPTCVVKTSCPNGSGGATKNVCYRPGPANAYSAGCPKNADGSPRACHCGPIS